MTREKALNSLSVVWAAIILPPILIMGLQTIAGKYGDDSELAWSWLLIQISPILSLLVAAVFSNPSSAWRRATANLFKWRCAIAVSLLQGAGMVAVLLIEPLIRMEPFELFDRTVLFLALLQGVAVAAVGSVVFDGR